MQTIRKTNLTYVINDLSVHMIYRKQCVIFNNFNARSLTGLKKFTSTIEHSSPKKYDNLNDVFSLARANGIKPEASSITYLKNIAF